MAKPTVADMTKHCDQWLLNAESRLDPGQPFDVELDIGLDNATSSGRLVS